MTRKMVFVVVAVMAFGCMSSFASISVNWITFGTITLSDGVTSLPVGSIAELIWSADNSINTISDSDPLTPQGGEVLLVNFATTDAGSITYSGDPLFVEANYGFSDTNYFAGGYVYTRVFNFLAANGTPTGGTWYGEGPMPITGPIPSQHVSTTPPEPMGSDITGGGSFALNQQIMIPEPATWAFMGLGALVVFMRRRMRKA